MFDDYGWAPRDPNATVLDTPTPAYDAANLRGIGVDMDWAMDPRKNFNCEIFPVRSVLARLGDTYSCIPCHHRVREMCERPQVCCMRKLE